MDWKTFAGSREGVYRALVIARALSDGVSLEPEELSHYFRLHLHRGISYLNAKALTSTGDMIGLVANSP
jgi:DNA sulfur modification protein DndE